MHLLFAFAISLVAACGVYLLLSRHVIGIVLGVSLLSAAINLVIFFVGRIVSSVPAVIPAGETTLPAEAANSLPQALILTAIVIGFSLLAFLAALALKTYNVLGTVDTSDMTAAERLGSPFKRKGDRS